MALCFCLTSLTGGSAYKKYPQIAQPNYIPEHVRATKLEL